jgi:ankyrin repeat protein
MPQSLPARANLEQLKKQAKEFHRAFNSPDPEVRQKVRELHPELARVSSEKLRLNDVQLLIARHYGFPSWRRLKEKVEAMTKTNVPMENLVKAVLGNDTARAREVLKEYPELKERLNDPIPEMSFGGKLMLGAVQRSNRDMVDLLLEAGADINGRSDWWAGGFGVLDDDHGLADFLIQRGARLDAHAAARLGRLDELKKLIGGNSELVHARGGDGQTPLHFASTVAIADYLLDQGAEIDALDVDHESTPAQYMIRDRQEVARRLVARGCRTDILMAAALGDLELVRKHLEAQPDCYRMTVSEQYFPKKNPRAGGSIYIWTIGQNKTPHQAAHQFGHETVYRLLMDRSPLELKLSQACELGDEEIFNDLLASRPDIASELSVEDRRKVTNAAQDNNVNAVRLMLSAGWPVDARGQHGATPLHWAAFHGNVDLIKVILKHGPPLECTDFDFKGTPLGWAIHGSENGWHAKTGDYVGTVEALLQAGAKPPKKPGGTEAVKAVLSRAGWE